MRNTTPGIQKKLLACDTMRKRLRALDPRNLATIEPVLLRPARFLIKVVSLVKAFLFQRTDLSIRRAWRDELLCFNIYLNEYFIGGVKCMAECTQEISITYITHIVKER
jgi:hypothetical protein